jgi:hypothetical protein
MTLSLLKRLNPLMAANGILPKIHWSFANASKAKKLPRPLRLPARSVSAKAGERVGVRGIIYDLNLERRDER